MKSLVIICALIFSSNALAGQKCVFGKSSKGRTALRCAGAIVKSLIKDGVPQTAISTLQGIRGAGQDLHLVSDDSVSDVRERLLKKGITVIGGVAAASIVGAAAVNAYKAESEKPENSPNRAVAAENALSSNPSVPDGDNRPVFVPINVPPERSNGVGSGGTAEPAGGHKVAK